jgi:putative nucleotidyltransferase with HDIG domain
MGTDKQLNDVDQILERLGGIPPIPAIASRVLQIASSENARLADLARLIASDQGLATQVLRTCNSAYYGIPQRVSSLSRAIALLGFKSVRNLVVIHSLPRRSGGTPTFAETAIWTHSGAGALAARGLAEVTGRCDPEEAMLGGLIHDSGRLVLNLMVPERYAPVMKAIYNRTGRSLDIERREIGLVHTVVGEAVLRKWNFPDALVHAVEHHHDDPATLDALTLIVSAADELLWLLGLGVMEPREPATEMPPALAHLGFRLADLPGLEERTKAVVEAGRDIFGHV